MTQTLPVWWCAVNGVEIVLLAASAVLLYLNLRRQRPPLPASGGYSRQSVDLSSSGPWADAGDSVIGGPCPFAHTCDHEHCRFENKTILAAQGGFGDPVCAKCGEPARMIESKVVSVPDEWRDLLRFGDAVVCDNCGFVSEGEVPFMSLDPSLRDDEERIRAAIGAAARELAQRVSECDRLGHIHNPNEGAE